MAKSSGGTRNKKPINNPAATQFERNLTPALMDAIADRIAKGGYVTFERAEANAWEDMTLDERELTLMLAGFTGLTNDELDGNGTLYVPIDKKQLVEEFQEALTNEMGFHGMDDSTIFTIGYKDGSRKYLSEMENDFEDSGITTSQSSRTQWEKAKAALKLRDVAYIIRSDGYQEPNYWVNGADGMRQLKQYGGFEEWKKGRGEKSRQYIQDDWI